MNKAIDNTALAEMPAGSRQVAMRKVNDIEDLLATIRHLNEAVFLAAAGLGTKEHIDAFQALSDEINNRLLTVSGRLDEVLEELV